MILFLATPSPSRFLSFAFPCHFLGASFGLAFDQAMAGACIQLETIELLEIFDPLQVSGAERALAIKSMQHDALQQVAEREIVVIGQRTQDFEQTLLHADPGLHSLYEVFLVRIFKAIHVFRYLCTKVHKPEAAVKETIGYGR
jgi:hypothetical protein